MITLNIGESNYNNKKNSYFSIKFVNYPIKMDKIDTITIKATIIALLSAINITPEVAGYLLTVIFVDSFFGIVKSLRMGRVFSFKILTQGMLSKFSILIIPFLIAYFGLTFGHNLVYVVDAFIYIIAANETVAIITKVGTIRTGKEYENADFIAVAINLLRDFFISKIEALTKSIKK
jgi:hypothetical protein